MFEKKDYIFSDTMGVCKVSDIVRLAPKNRIGEPVPYYLLKSVFDKSKVAYIPVEKHQVALRPLMTKEEALAVTEEAMEKMNELQKAEVQFVLEERDKAKKK